jgi:hypothetical protein
VELKPLIEDSLQTAKKPGILKAQFRSATLPADTNYFSEANCRYLLQKQKMKALIPSATGTDVQRGRLSPTTARAQPDNTEDENTALVWGNSPLPLR